MFQNQREGMIVRFLNSTIAPFVMMVAGLLLAPISNSAAAEQNNVALVLDASGSMNGKIKGGQIKIDAAKKAVAEMVNQMDGSINLSLRAYGHQFHRREKNCKDTSLVVPFGVLSDVASKVTSKANGLTAQGYTPITYVLGLAADDLKDLPGKRTIILVSDGKETCEGDPCLLAQKLAEADAQLTIHTIGFGVDAQTRAQLQCIADEGRGKYHSANSAAQLAASMASAAETEAEEIIIVVKKKVPGTLIIENAGYHHITDAQTGEKVGTIGTGDKGTIELPAGIYNAQFGKDLFWKSIRVSAGETTTIKAGRLVIAKNQYHHILDPETGERYSSYGTGDKFVVLPPGRFDISFNKARWKNVEIKEGETTLLEPAELIINNNGFHSVKDAETGKKVISYSSSTKRLALPGGEYDVLFGQVPWRVHLENGKTTTLDPAILVINNNQYHKLRDVETGKNVATYASSSKKLQLAPGQYDVVFGKTTWRISANEGEQITLNPGGIGVRPQGYHKVFNKDGSEAGKIGSSDKQLMLPPGDYLVDIADQKVPFTISEGKIVLIKVE